MTKKSTTKRKKTSLANVNPYLADPATWEAVTVMAVQSANRMEGIKVATKVIREHYRIIQEEAGRA